MAYNITSNRGMTGFPAEYVQAWQNYNPVQQAGGGLTGKAARNANAAENMAYAQGGSSNGLMSLLSPYSLSNAGSAIGGGQSVSIPYRGRKPRWGPGAAGTNLIDRYAGNAPAGGGGGGGGGGGTPTAPSTPTPTAPATPSPTQQMGNNLQALLAGYTNPITNGLLSNESIQQAMSTLNAAGMPAWAAQQFGGNFQQNLAQDVGRAGINLQRGAAEQQSSMDLAHQRAKAGAGLDMAGLLQQLNEQNVMHGLNMQSGGLGAILNLLGGVL